MDPIVESTLSALEIPASVIPTIRYAMAAYRRQDGDTLLRVMYDVYPDGTRAAEVATRALQNAMRNSLAEMYPASIHSLIDTSIRYSWYVTRQAPLLVAATVAPEVFGKQSQYTIEKQLQKMLEAISMGSRRDAERAISYMEQMIAEEFSREAPDKRKRMKKFVESVRLTLEPFSAGDGYYGIFAALYPELEQEIHRIQMGGQSSSTQINSALEEMHDMLLRGVSNALPPVHRDAIEASPANPVKGAVDLKNTWQGELLRGMGVPASNVDRVLLSRVDDKPSIYSVALAHSGYTGKRPEKSWPLAMMALREAADYDPATRFTPLNMEPTKIIAGEYYFRTETVCGSDAGIGRMMAMLSSDGVRQPEIYPYAEYAAKVIQRGDSFDSRRIDEFVAAYEELTGCDASPSAIWIVMRAANGGLNDLAEYADRASSANMKQALKWLSKCSIKTYEAYKHLYT